MLTVFFQNQNFQKTIFFLNTIRVVYQLNQGQHSVGPDLSPNCLQRLSTDSESADDNVADGEERVNYCGFTECPLEE